jgi:hypothetical protein
MGTVVNILVLGDKFRGVFNHNILRINDDTLFFSYLDESDFDIFYLNYYCQFDIIVSQWRFGLLQIALNRNLEQKKPILILASGAYDYCTKGMSVPFGGICDAVNGADDFDWFIQTTLYIYSAVLEGRIPEHTLANCVEIAKKMRIFDKIYLDPPKIACHIPSYNSFVGYLSYLSWLFYRTADNWNNLSAELSFKMASASYLAKIEQNTKRSHGLMSNSKLLLERDYEKDEERVLVVPFYPRVNGYYQNLIEPMQDLGFRVKENRGDYWILAYTE